MNNNLLPNQCQSASTGPELGINL